MGVREGVKHLVKNKSFWWAAILCTVNLGMVFSVSVLIIEAIAPFGYTDQQAGLASAIVVLAGYPGGILTGYWAGKTAQHIMLIKIFTPFMVFSYVMFIFDSKILYMLYSIDLTNFSLLKSDT
jgi:hypothetical protein